MIWKALKIFLLLALVAALASFASGNLGNVRVVWFGRLFESSVPVAAALFWALVQLLITIAKLAIAVLRKKRASDE
jgi:hypothetical protein